MVYNDAHDKDAAQTSIAGTSYYVGDANVDNSIDIIDATVIQRDVAKAAPLSGVAADLSDYDLDGITSIIDATLVQTYLAQGRYL